jgi:hypothetical protein
MAILVKIIWLVNMVVVMAYEFVVVDFALLV